MSRTDRSKLQQHGTSRHFLLSRSAARPPEDRPAAETAAVGRALAEKFPGLPPAEGFAAHAAAALDGGEPFAAMAVRAEPGPDQEGPAEFSLAERLLALAEILDGICRPKKGLWGLIRPEVLCACLPATDAERMRSEADALQQAARQRLKLELIIGVTAWPTLSYNPAEVVENTLKALDHAAFFGPGHTVLFDAVSLNISADRLYDQGQVALAIAEFQRALELDPGNVNVHNSLGVCHGVLGQYRRAKAAFHKALALDPKEYMAAYNLGLVLLQEGDPQGALDKFLAADEMAGGVFEILFQIGKLYLETGEPERGKDYLERAAAVEPRNSQVYRYLGDGYRTLGQEEMAVRAYEKAVRINPNDAASLSELGWLMDRRGENPDIALVFCRQSVELAPSNGLFRYRLGAICRRQDRLAEALEAFRHAELLGHDVTEDIREIEALMAGGDQAQAGARR